MRAWQDHLDAMVAAAARSSLVPVHVQHASACDTAHHRKVHTAQRPCITHSTLFVYKLFCSRYSVHSL